MITMVQPLHIGNALRLFIQPPAGAVLWRVLRKGSDTFTGPDDAEALVAYEGGERVIVDSHYLQNEVMAFYRPYYTQDGTTWTAGPTAHGTPVADYDDYATDVLSLVRERLEVGLKVEVERKNLQNELGYIQVFTSPQALDQGGRFPLVSITLESETDEVRAIGDDISGDEFDSVGFDWLESEGWLARVQLSIIGWSLNSDERNELRKAIRRIIVGNLQVFTNAGLDQIGLSMNDVDSVGEEYNAAVYQVQASFSCLAPVRVGGRVPAIKAVTSRSTTNG